jgi:Flp pilus assembly protein TadB
VALAAAAVATALLIAPAAQHRVLFRQHDKEKLLRRGNHSAFAGLVVLAVAIVAAVLLVVDVLYSRTLAWATAGVLSALLAWWWVAVPLWQRAHNRQDPLDD